MHGALLGAALALMLGISPMPPAMAASVITGIVIAVISWRGRVSAGGSLGLIMTVCMGLAFIIFYKSNVHAAEAFNIFWGNILTLSVSDAVLACAVSAAILAFTAGAYKEIHIVLFDRELACAVGVQARLVYSFIMLLVCLGIAVAIRVTGALMVDALTILPALAARKIGKTFRGVLIAGSIAGLCINLSGFALSFTFDLPVSAAIILAGAALILILRFVKRG
jgi:zinc transport system permease protein